MQWDFFKTENCISIESSLSMLKFLLPDDSIRGGVISADIGLNFKMRKPLGKAHLIYSDTQKCFAWWEPGKNMSHEAAYIVFVCFRFLCKLRDRYLINYFESNFHFRRFEKTISLFTPVCNLLIEKKNGSQNGSPCYAIAGRVSRRNNSFYLIPREESCANIPRLSYVNNDNKHVKNCLSKL